MWGWLWLSNSASHSPRIVRQIALTQQNAFLWVAFGTQQNVLSYVSCVKPSLYFFYIRPY
ncbi:hypothetical protein LeptoLang_06685 [Leptospira interrogans serovar Icterohaemorrhagiae]|nr:hypothetical protein LeptoLang_06685 [Leptospira interrogans serovar Icterohaemorrhagiae]